MPLRLLLVFLSAATLTGCGRRGALEAPQPPEATVISGQPVPSAVAGEAEPPSPGSDLVSDPATPGGAISREQQSAGAQEPAEAVPANPPKGGFFLDPLL